MRYVSYVCRTDTLGQITLDVLADDLHVLTYIVNHSLIVADILDNLI